MKVIVKQIASAIGSTDVQKANLRSLKLGEIGKSATFFNIDASFKGRLKVIRHLVEVKELMDK